MSLMLPGNIPVAASSLADIRNCAEIADIAGYGLEDALASKTVAPYDEIVIWVRPTLRGYKGVWRSAVQMGLVDDESDIDHYGGTVDIDHVFPRSWAQLPEFHVSYVRIYPVWREVNRSAGGGRERRDPSSRGFKPNKMENGIYFASDLQLRKLLGHPVGSTKDRKAVFTS